MCAHFWSINKFQSSITLGISEDDVIKKVMLKETVDGEFTTTKDIANVALFFH